MAVVSFVGPLQNADFSKMVVRAGLVTDDGEYRDVAI